MDRHIPTKDQVLAYLLEDHNWGRWGADDQLGAVNLITPQKRVAAARLVRTGRAISLSREMPTPKASAAPGQPIHATDRHDHTPTYGSVLDGYYGISYHGTDTTHLDALCHVWGEKGMWNGRNPDQEITAEGVNWGSVEHWKEGFITRGVLLDVPKHRRELFVTLDKPVHGWELEDIAREEGVTLDPGDALVVYCGREACVPPWGSSKHERPGLHASCLKFIRQVDCSLLVWDVKDFMPTGYDLPWTVGGAVFAYGIGTVDNASLGPLAKACAEEGRYEFMLMVGPLLTVGGTGSPVNPIALF